MSIEALLSRRDGSDEAVDLERWAPRPISDEELLWVDLAGTDEDEVRSVARALDLDGRTVEVLGLASTTPVVAVLADAVEVVVHAPGDGAGDEPVPLRVLVGDGWLITSHPEPIPFLAEHRERIQDQREVGALSAVEFLADILDWHVDAFLRVAGELEAEVDRLDEAALRTDRDLLDRLVDMRRRISRLRRLLRPHREVYAELGRPDILHDLDDSEVQALSAVVARLERANDAIANVREMLIGTFDVHMTRTAQRTNDIMKVLTLASVVLLPSVVLAGVMGMNFKIGFFDNPDMFWVVIGGMVTLAVVTLGVGRWRGWL